MMSFARSAALWLAVAPIVHCLAQSDSLLTVKGPAVQIGATDATSLSTTRLDSTLNLTDALSKVAAVQVQQLSPGGLATALSGGSSARHLAILWQGWNIQSPVNGTYDLSLIPLSVFDKSSYSDRVALAGTGNAAHRGILTLDQREQSSRIGYSYDTWNDHMIEGQTTLNTKLAVCTVSGRWANRDLAYRFDRFGEETRQDHADAVVADVQVGLYRQLTNAWAVQVRSWWQDADRSLSPSKAAASRGESQTDRNTRTALQADYRQQDHHLIVKAAYFDEYINYRSSLVDSRASNYASMMSATYHFGKKSRTTIEALHRRDLIRSNFEINDSRQTTQLLVARTWLLSPTMTVKTSIRQDIIDDRRQPLTYSASGLYTTGQWQGELTYTRSYTTPTFNDLYWPQGGDSNLLPERSQLLALALSREEVLPGLSVRAGAHYQQVADLILWSPGDGGIWTPSNQRQVESWNAFIEPSYKRAVGAVGLVSAKANISYGPSRAIDNSQDRAFQLIYLPRFRSTGQLTLSHKQAQASLQLQHTGRRFTDFRNTASLHPFTLMHLGGRYSITDKLSLGLSARNVLDEVYEVVPFYPTSLRHCLIDIQFDIH